MNPASVPVRDMFEALVPEYDRFNHWSSLGLDARWRRDVVRLLSDADRILDVGTGTGDLAHALAREGREVVGVDFSPRMVDAAKRKCAEDPRISFRVASADELPFDSGSFDGICSAFVVRNLFHQNLLGASFREFHRLLKTGGQSVHLELVRPPKGLLKVGHRFYLQTMLPLLGYLNFGRRWPKGYLRETIERFPKPVEICREFRGAGFDRVCHYPLNGGIAGLFVGVRC